MHRDLHHIPLSDLKLSKLNVRRHGAKDIDSLAASIAALVQVSRTPAATVYPRAVKPASEKRQGTKSRAGEARGCSECYGDSAPTLLFGA
jgi:hypothetical protein